VRVIHAMQGRRTDHLWFGEGGRARTPHPPPPAHELKARPLMIIFRPADTSALEGWQSGLMHQS
jgi:hypothetical protein